MALNTKTQTKPKLDVCTSDGGNIHTELKKTVLPICEVGRGSGKVTIDQKLCAVLCLKLFNLVTFVPLFYQTHTI